jgi:hypothetical protein
LATLTNCFHAATDKGGPLRFFFVLPGMSRVIPSSCVCFWAVMILQCLFLGRPTAAARPVLR